MVDPQAVPSVPLRTAGAPIEIPQVGFGLWQVPDDEAEAAILTALESGYRHLDTARLYYNEEAVGRALRSSSVPRDEVFVTTKVWNDYHLRVRESVEGSMERLGLDVLDLCLIHWPVPAADAYATAWASLLELRSEGLIKAVGVSNFHVPHLERCKAETGEFPAIDQVELHPYLQQDQVRDFCADNDIVVESWSPLASGKRVLDDEVIGEMASRYGVTPAQVIVRWHLQLGLVVLPKSVTPSRIAENIDVFGFELSAEDMVRMSTLDQGFRTGPDPDEFAMDAVR